MGIGLRVVDYNKMLSELPFPPVIVNDLDVNYRDHEDKLNRLLLTNYTGPTFSMEPTCECGKEHGGDRRGKVCKECGTRVLSHVEKDIHSEVWLRVPDDIPAFINPYIYAVLSDRFKDHKVDVMQWLLDPNYVGHFDNIPIIQYLKDAGIRRGLINLHDRFDEIMALLLEFPKNKLKEGYAELVEFIRMNRHLVFTEYLPIPNKMTFVVEKSPTGKFAELKSFVTAIDAVNNIASLKTRLLEPSKAVRENVAIKVVLNLSEFYKQQIKAAHSGKYGQWRKHIFGSRMPFTGRAVISSLNEIHDYDECHAPWGMAVVCLSLHISNVLYKRGYTTNEALAKISKAVRYFDEEIEEIIDDLIANSPHRTALTGKPGLPILINRNPSLLYTNIQMFYVTKVHKQVECPSLSFSPTCYAGLNADLFFL